VFWRSQLLSWDEGYIANSSKQGECQRNVTIHKQEHTADKLNGADKK
jgi:hypothetical protein